MSNYFICYKTDNCTSVHYKLEYIIDLPCLPALPACQPETARGDPVLHSIQHTARLALAYPC